MVESEGWAIAKEIFDNYIAAVSDITLLDTKANIDDIGKEAYARAKAIQIVKAWYNDIQNNIELYEENVYLKAEEKEGQIVREL